MELKETLLKMKKKKHFVFQPQPPRPQFFVNFKEISEDGFLIEERKYELESLS